ncbi:MAG: S9 family peptidase [Acidimicrobiia bacterium]|nr:S9 family peptidase [Acidimicrobiia bacterium]
MHTKRTVLVAAALVVLAAPAFAQGQERVTHEALWLMPRVGAPAPSPDGRWVVFPVVQPAYDEREQTSDLWVVPADGSAPPRKLTSTRAAEGGIAWSPDSRRIAFVTRREGDDANQIYVLDLSGGEAMRVTTLSTGAAAPVWRPDGGALLFTSLVYPGATDDAANRREMQARRDRKYNVRTFDSFPLRMWDRWLDDRRPHVFVQSLEPGAAAVDLLAGTRLVQHAGYGGRLTDESDVIDATWAPDGQSVVFIATTQRTEAARSPVHEHLFQVSVSGGEPRQLTSDDRSYARPAFSRDGRTLYVAVAEDHNQIYSLDRIAAAPWPWSRTPAVLDPTFDRSAAGFAVAADGQTVYVTAEDLGQEKLYAVPAGGARAQLAVAPASGVYTNLRSASAAPLLVANWGSAVQPAEIVRIDPATRQHRLLTGFTTARAQALAWQPLRHFTFTSSRGKTVHNLVALPHGFDQSRKYPLLVLIHGGPANMWRDQITLRWNYHLLADPGYVVLMTNYTGSTGFGEQFARDIRLDPFAGPATEINEAADEAIRRFSFIDGSRQIAAGASYGGHLINWLQATTTRYTALVGHAGLVNSEVQWGTSDVVYGRELMNGGPPWEQAKTWIEQNPIRHAAKFRTPILLSIGERDYRVPLNNTLENWSALQRMKVPSRLLVWPDENHWIGSGENSRHFYTEVRAWFARWVPPSNDATQ